MYILGIHQSHNATACLLKDGKIIAACSEERFTRLKNQFGVPFKAIKNCFDFANIKPQDLDLIIVPGSTWPNYISSLEAAQATKKTSYKFLFHLRLLHQKTHAFLCFLEYKFPFLKGVDLLFNHTVYGFLSKIFYSETYKLIVKEFNLPKERFLVIDHHLSHALAALYSSPYPQQGRKVLVFTCDGAGDGLSATISIFKNGRIKRMIATTDQNSLGALFAGITEFLGMKALEHEYKLMGLAPYAAADGVAKAYQVLSRYIGLDQKSLTFKNLYTPDVLWFVFRHELMYLRFDYIAGAIQKLTEEILTSWVKAAIKKYKIQTIACGGGVFMNVKANLKISQLSEVKEMFVMPSAGDESNAIGACYYGHLLKQKGKKNLPQPLKDLYLGPEYSKAALEKAIKSAKFGHRYQVKYCYNIEKTIADLLVKGDIVARFAGRMEWGARALGNRSILADASLPEVKEIINKMIKSRDFWMPFAPVILKEHQKKYLINPKKIDSPYMVFAFPGTLKAQKDLTAAMHPYDKTLRPQIIEKDWNPSYYQILKYFYQKTGRAGLLNTSFNLHGEPIVCSPQNAIDTFKNSGLKFLALGNWLISKKTRSHKTNE